MKAKYIIASLVAVCALAIGCTKDTPTVLDEVQVSSSYIGLTNNEGANTKTITVNAKESWSISEMPEWLSISPASGSAGETTVTFSADKAPETRQVNIKLACAGKEQTIIVKQEAEKVTPRTLTIAEALQVIEQYPDGSPVQRVKGIVCKIQEISPSYGNATYYLSEDGKFEDGKWLQVYRGLWMNGAAFTKGDEFALGDELTIEGVLMSYKGTPETKEKEAYVIEINKSLIKCDSLVYNGVQLETLPIEGGSFEAALTCKGNGVSVVIPDDAKSWLSVTGIQTSGTTATVSFVAAANEGGDRSTELTFTTTDGTKEYTASASVAQLGSIIECSILDFNSAEVGDTQYRLTGMVTEIAKADYGNIYISDWSDKTYVYGIGAKGDFATLGVEVGDIITLVGKRAAYNGNPQMAGGQYESHIDVTEVDFPTFNAAEASKDVYYRLTGTITKIAKADYGNLYIQDDAGNEVYVYGVYSGWGASGDARKGALARYGIEVGDILTVEGYKDVYNGTIELCGGIYVSHEKGEAADEGGEGGEGDDGSGTGSEGTSVTFTVDNLPTAYAADGTVTYGAFDFYINQVANYGNGIQMKKAESYIANKTAFKKIKKITLVGQDGKTWYPGNLQMFGGSAEKPETEITATDDQCLVYDFSGSNCSYFKLANTSNYAVYLKSITVEYE